MRGPQKALAIAAGELKLGRVHAVENVNAAAGRKRQMPLQAVLAARYDIHVATFWD